MLSPARLPLLTSLLLGACASEETPAWAFDPIRLEPAGTADVLGFQTWHVYAEPWAKSRDERHFVCAVVTELVGTPSTACPDCDVAWAVASTQLETDCAPAVGDDPLFTSVVGIGLSAGAPSADAPHPGLTTVGHVDYGFGWEVHGDAWPEALDTGGTAESADWTGTAPFALWPTAIWPLDPAATADETAETATPVSRLAVRPAEGSG